MVMGPVNWIRFVWLSAVQAVYGRDRLGDDGPAPTDLRARAAGWMLGRAVF
jgi:hypothetical protein